MRLEDEDIQKMVHEVMAELDRRRFIEQVADAVMRKQAELQRRIATAPRRYEPRQKPAANPDAPESDTPQPDIDQPAAQPEDS